MCNLDDLKPTKVEFCNIPTNCCRVLFDSSAWASTTGRNSLDAAHHLPGSTIETNPLLRVILYNS